MTGTGTVHLSLPGGVAHDAAGHPNWASGDEDGWAIFLANPWQNYPLVHDVSDDGHVTPLDALMVINWLNAYGFGPLPTEPLTPPRYIDVDGNRMATPIDALLVINYLNRQALEIGEGEPDRYSPVPNIFFFPTTDLIGPPLTSEFADPAAPRTPFVTPQPASGRLQPPIDDTVFRELANIWDDADRFLYDSAPEESEDDAPPSAFAELDEILPDLAIDVQRYWR